MNNLRSTFASKILSNIPLHVKPIDYLMETLNISRESVYRRIRGDISFTFEEIAKLSIDLGFSIDELIMKDMPSHVFFDLHVDNTNDPSEVFTIIFQQYFQSLFEISPTKPIESTMVLNHIPFEFLIFFNHLFKYSYYRWMQRFQESSLKYFYSDVSVPDKLISLQQKAIARLPQIHTTTFIFDSDVFLNLIREIQYYYKRRLITENEFLQLHDDLLGLIDMVESIAQTGVYASETKFNFYLSMLNIESSSRYVKCGDIVKSQFFVNAIEPISIINPTLCVLHKKWMDSVRKYSTLISQSNEIVQVRYFDRQRTYIDEIVDVPNTVLL